MKLNRIEFLAMNNYVRNLLQKFVEFPRIKNCVSVAGNILEIGCGTGYGSKLIKNNFAVKKIIATDLDKKMIEIAKRKNSDKKILFEVQDATNLKYKNNSFDAVFEFGAIHHIPNWKDCLKELKRVLKPNGQLIVDELSKETFLTRFGRLMKFLSHHPYDSMFYESEFVNYLEKIGFEIVVHKQYFPLVRYFVVVAKKKEKVIKM